MERFVGRTKELALLEKIWSGTANKTCVIYGRRRIGKTELLKRFCLNKRSLYFECIQGVLADNLDLLSKTLTLADGKQRKEYRFIREAFEDIKEFCVSSPAVIVFDEYPYLLSTGTQIASSMQHLIRYPKRSR